MVRNGRKVVQVFHILEALGTVQAQVFSYGLEGSNVRTLAHKHTGRIGRYYVE
jgi:hypothetical protein